MSEGKKKALIDLSSRYEIPVIEDDVSSQLHFGDQRPPPLKAYDRKGLVLTCSSFSKTLAPGLRLGWVIPGTRFSPRIQRLKAGMTISTSTLDQYIVSSLLASGAYDRHLRVLRSALKKQVFKTALEIQRHFPEQTRLAVPQGGSLLWVQLPPGVDGLSVYQTALTGTSRSSPARSVRTPSGSTTTFKSRAQRPSTGESRTPSACWVDRLRPREGSGGSEEGGPMSLLRRLLLQRLLQVAVVASHGVGGGEGVWPNTRSLAASTVQGASLYLKTSESCPRTGRGAR